MNVCPTTQIAGLARSKNVEISNRPYLIATWRQGTPLAEINAMLPPWLALTIEQYTKRDQAFLQVNNNTGDVEWWYRGFVALIGPPPPPDAGPEWRYTPPAATRADSRHERTVTLEQYDQTV